MQTLPQRSVHWVDWRGNPISGGMTANLGMVSTVRSVAHGETLGNVEDLLFRDPGYFRAGELHNHLDSWRAIIGDFPSPQESEILQLIESKVSIFPYFRSFSGSFKGETYESDHPPRKAFLNNASCKPFVQFIQRTLLERMENGAVSLVGKVGVVEPPYLVLPLTVEPSKPRLCHDARFLN